VTGLAALRDRVTGEVLLPADTGYDAARRPAIERFHDTRPAAVVRCRTPADVAAVLAAGTPVHVRSGGHCFAGRSSGDGVVIDVGPMDDVALDGDTATIGAGARLGAVYDALAARGRTIAAGCGPDVGIAGLALGGGLGLLGRRHGLLTDQLLGAEVVLADGRVVACDAEREPDLFWALRGAGGGQFGVVTRLRVATLPEPVATSFHAAFPAAAAADVIDAWQRWAPPAPDELAASLLVTAPDDPAAPVAVTVFGTVVGDTPLAPLLARLGMAPARSTSARRGYRETKATLAAGDERNAGPPRHGFPKSEFFRAPLPRDRIEALVAHLAEDRRAGEARELDFTPWGGAYNRVPADATAFPHRAERFLLKHDVTVRADAGAQERAAARAWIKRSWELVHPAGSGGAYVNFPDPDLDGWERAYHRDNLERLVAVKAAYDPGDVFRFPQSLPASQALGA
jgi:FAD/FMN-containing dehydrogenase